jgi:putative hydroxymethylpyrimidine transporter CytX
MQYSSEDNIIKGGGIVAHSAIWFGAAVSVAELLTGTLIAPLGLRDGLSAILLGHLIGCVPLFFAALIGARTNLSAMGTASLAFGRLGGRCFAALNVLQLLGWTAVMIAGGAGSAGAILNLGGNWAWALVIAAIIALWLAIGPKRLAWLNSAAVLALFALTIILCALVACESGLLTQAAAIQGAALLDPQLDPVAAVAPMTFSSAVELSAAMPISWLPLIADYTRKAKRPLAVSAASVATYGIVSCWMFAIGLVLMLASGESDVLAVFPAAGMAAAGLAVVVLSTVTTTFLDAHSAGVSAASIDDRLRVRPVGLAVVAFGAALAIFVPVQGYEAFLYLIGSVFAPMAAVLISDYYIQQRGSPKARVRGDTRRYLANAAIWLFGFILYRFWMDFGTPLGTTLPVMAACAATRLAVAAAVCLYNSKWNVEERSNKL